MGLLLPFMLSVSDLELFPLLVGKSVSHAAVTLLVTLVPACNADGLPCQGDELERDHRDETFIETVVDTVTSVLTVACAGLHTLHAQVWKPCTCRKTSFTSSSTPPLITHIH